MIPQFKSMTEMLERFPDEQACIDHLTEIRWRNGKFCPHCGSIKVYTFLELGSIRMTIPPIKGWELSIFMER